MALPQVQTTRRPLWWRARTSARSGSSAGPDAGLATSPLPLPTTRPHPAARLGSPWSPLVVAFGLFFACWAALAGLAAFLPRRPAVAFAGMNDLLTAGAAFAAVVLGTLAMAQWRVDRVRTRDLGVGVGFVLYGAIVLYGGRILPIGRATSPVVLGYIPAATVLVVFGLIGWSVATCGKSIAGWSRRACGEIVLLLAALTTALQFAPRISRALTMVSLSTPAVGGQAFGQLVLALAWSVVVTLALLREADGSPWRRDIAVAIVALGLVQGRLALALAPNGTSVWVMGSHLFQLTGFAIAFAVVAAEFGERATSQHGQILDSLVAARTDSARRLARQTIEAGHGHDIRSALFAIDGAAQTLADRYDDLAASDRTALGRMVGVGVDRLRQLVEVRMEEIEDFGVDTVVRSVVHSERRLGVSVTTTLPAGLRGVGRAADLAVVLHILIRSPRIRSGRAPLVVRGSRQGDAVLVLVEAAGLGPDPMVVSPDRLDGTLMAPFDRLEPELGREVGGDALDLYVASRLMGEQGGDIWTAARPGGGVSFGVRLPAATAATLPAVLAVAAEPAAAVTASR
jgi:signal transduction histidine kinase